MFAVKRELAPRRRLPKPNKHLSLRKYEATVGFLFLLPWLLGFLFFKAVPILAALGFSFTNFHMLEPEKTHFIGLANYLTFFRDSAGGASLFGSISYFLLSVPLEMVVALFLAAVFTSDRLHGKRIMRTLFFMPSIIPAIAIYIIISGLTDPNTGWIIRLFPWSKSFPLYIFFPVILSLWTIGPGFLIMLAAMQAVPKEFYEAARVDGAGPINRFVSITIPMCSPAIFFSLVINMISSFGGVALLDRGLPYSQSLSPMETYITRQMFAYTNLGYASALAWIMFIVVMAITILLFRSTRYWVHFPEESSNEEI
ncbi:MAG: sugar ABC transporter permease [Anaerolineales bacterium]|jgi:multiple sugar transport system permease protein